MECECTTEALAGTRKWCAACQAEYNAWLDEQRAKAEQAEYLKELGLKAPISFTADLLDIWIGTPQERKN